jgi:uncharacterized protein
MTAPGVYIKEIPSGVRPITGVATSITAFLGRTPRGPAGEPRMVSGFADYQRIFGGLAADSSVGYAVRDFFTNGGGQALIVRIVSGDSATTTVLTCGTLGLVARSAGAWSTTLKAAITAGSPDQFVAQRYGVATGQLFTLTVDDGAGTVETFPNLTVAPGTPRFVTDVLEAESTLVRIDPAKPVPTTLPAAATSTVATAGVDGGPLKADDYIGGDKEAKHEGLWALDKADLFNLLCIPPATTADGDKTDPAVWTKALGYCVKRRAMLLVDPPTATIPPDTAATVLGGLTLTGPDTRNAAFYYPMLRAPDPLAENRLRTFVPCGAVAGVMARTDAARGVWKAPAGIDAGVAGTSDLTARLTETENGTLNQIGINCLRTFPIIGRVVWGARTMRGADLIADEYKYLPVRRFALFLEESLYRGTQWVVFEPNDEPLWAQIRLNLGAFMQGLFRQGAFEGRTPRDAYLIKCDGETTTANDRNLGRVNILVGFAPLRPAEFVYLQIQQIARAEV